MNESMLVTFKMERLLWMAHGEKSTFLAHLELVR